VIDPNLKLDRRFVNNAKGFIEAYSFEVGILDDKPHRMAMRGQRGLKGKDVLSSYAGGPVRKASRQKSDKSVAAVSKELRENLGKNYMTEPFNRKSSDIVRFSKRFFDVVKGKSQPKRLENLLQAIVRNPILKGSYGNNSALTKRIKGFDRLMIDTGQLFKAIKAKVQRKAVSRV
jgi:hypothetical protein